jgi:hypothetical protein
MPISSTVNDPSLMAALELNVIVLAAVFPVQVVEISLIMVLKTQAMTPLLTSR